MIDAVVGAVIIIAVTSSLILAVELGESVVNDSGRYPLTENERMLLLSAGYSDAQSMQSIDDYLRSLPITIK